MNTLLPPNAAPLERALESVAAARFDVVAVERLRNLANPRAIPAALLPWLAWAYSVDEWDSTWTEPVQREVVAQSIEVHRRKGTVGAVRRALAAAGYGDARLIEGRSGAVYDGLYQYDGTRIYGDDSQWAVYAIEVDTLLSLATTVMLAAVAAAVQPVRCHCYEVRGRALLYAATARYDGTYRFGGTVAALRLDAATLAAISTATANTLEALP